MTVPAVGEKPAGVDDEGKPAGDLNDDANDDDADDDDGGDTGDDTDDDGDGGDGDDGAPDPVAAEAARVEAERVAAIKADARKEFLAEQQAERDAAAEADRKAKLETLFEDAEAKAIATLTGHKLEAHDANGNKVVLQLTSEQAKAALEAYTGYRTEAGTIETTRVMNALSQVAGEIITDSAVQAEFNKKVGGKDAKVWLKELIEHAAPTTKAFEAAVSKAKADGFEAGKNAPPGQVSQQGGRSAGRAKTFEQLADGYGAGTNTEAEDVEYLRLEKERGG